MITHILRMIWNRKQANLLLLLEMLLSSLVLFLVLSQVLHGLRKAMEPLGFDYRNVLVMDIRSASDDPMLNNLRLQEVLEVLRQQPEVESVGAMSPTPYIRSTWRTSFDEAPENFLTNMHRAMPGIEGALGATLSDGEWPTVAALDGARVPVVVNHAFIRGYWPDEADDILAGKSRVVGRPVGDPEDRMEVAGVLPWLRPQGELMQTVPLMMMFMHPDGRDSMFVDGVLLRLRPDTDLGPLEERIVTQVGRLAPEWSLRLDSMDRLRANILRESALPLLLAVLVTGFLLLMVGLGLIGVLWQSVTRRRAELGLRRALGATRRQIGLQLLGEIAILGLLAQVGSWIVILQLPFLGYTKDMGWGTFLLSLVLSAVCILGLALLAGAYPGWLSTRIAPSEALHHD